LRAPLRESMRTLLKLTTSLYSSKGNPVFWRTALSRPGWRNIRKTA